MALTNEQKLSLYNGALTVAGERLLSSVSDNVPARRYLDAVYDAKFLKEILQAGQWNFAARTALLDYNPAIVSQFGFEYAFDKPTDWVRTIGISDNEYLTPPLNRYIDEAGYWWADVEELYVRFISDGASYGGNYAKWPANFLYYAECRLAFRAAPKITQDKEKMAFIKKEMKDALVHARSTDAMDDPIGRPPRGSWSTARSGSRSTAERRGS